MVLGASVPAFGAGTATWAAALALISLPRYFPPLVRGLGLLAALLFAATAVQIFAGVPLLPTTQPLPFFAYPVFVATFVGWIWTFLRLEGRRGDHSELRPKSGNESPHLQRIS
jgi:hypothetical protein